MPRRDQVKTSWHPMKETVLGVSKAIRENEHVERIKDKGGNLATIVLADFEYANNKLNTNKSIISEIGAIKDTVRPLEKFSKLSEEGIKGLLLRRNQLRSRR